METNTPIISNAMNDSNGKAVIEITSLTYYPSNPIIVTIPKGNNQGYLFAIPHVFPLSSSQPKYTISVENVTTGTTDTYVTNNQTNVGYLTKGLTTTKHIHLPGDTSKNSIYKITVRNFNGNTSLQSLNFRTPNVGNTSGFIVALDYNNADNNTTDGVIIIIMNDLL